MGSSLVEQLRKIRDKAGTQEVTILFLRDEDIQGQQIAKDFEERLADLMVDK